MHDADDDDDDDDDDDIDEDDDDDDDDDDDWFLALSCDLLKVYLVYKRKCRGAWRLLFGLLQALFECFPKTVSGSPAVYDYTID